MKYISSLTICIIFFTRSIYSENSIIDLKNWEFLIEQNNSKINCNQRDGWKSFQFPGQPKGIKPEDILWERTIIHPDNKEQTLKFLSVDQLFQIYLDDKEFYSVGDPSNPNEMTSGNTLHLVALPKKTEPTHLCFRLFARTSNVGLNGEVSIGSGQDHLSILFKKEIPRLIFIGLFFLIGISLISIFLLKYKEIGYLSFGLFLIAFSIWLLTQTEIKSIFYHNTIFWRTLDILFLFQIPIWIMKFYIEVFGKGPKNITYRFFQLNLAYTFLTWSLLILRITHLEYLLLPFQIFILIELFYLITLSFLTAWKGDYEAKLFFSGMGVLCFTGVLDFLGALGIISWSMPTAIWGVSLLILFTIIILIRRTISSRIFAEKNKISPECKQSLFVNLQTKYRLTYSEVKVCCALDAGVNRSELLKKLNIEDGTLKNHLFSIYKKTINLERPDLSDKKDKLQRLTVFLQKVQ